MPPVSQSSLILVTGASGFLAVHVVKSLLRRGHRVRGTVRSAPKGEYLRDLFDPEFPGKFEYVIVKDIAQARAFDDAVKDVDGIAHTASPVVFSGPEDPPESLIKPAVAGTVGLLNSAQKFGSNVQRVVLTSSYAALLEPHDGPYEYSENDWNEYSIAEAYKAGPHAGVHKYRASKSLAERSFWNFISEQKPQFDGVSANPPFIYGPLLHEISSIDQLNLSTKLLWDKFAHELPEGELTAYAGNFIDVRDAAEVHADALEKAEAAGHRLVVSAGSVCHQDFCE
ncbi:D-lactaldehyde dehydrogenase [Auricularia subglabra TFB-10046 SS5]|uniref:D-lactaldehyde dehydrogenase n=1 Tax=Auricularia subglabra (strain TFB-10046 / SS5) TaxID=717982 RepID=J0WWH1_AURST|nr:D-lactaldehyde dehydrogenase [Auricularia subglabra TFB-10046 SS5]